MKYKYLRNKTYKKYKKIKTVYCPYLKTKVKFNSKGFHHIIYKAGHKKRDEESQISRFKLINKAMAVIRITTTLQEYQKEIKDITITYFGFIAIIDNDKFKVIIKKIGNGKHFFWSVIPNWRTRRKEKLFSKGSLEED